MRLKSALLLALLPAVTACGTCEKAIKYELFRIGNTNLSAPAYIREDKMPISWKLLTDNLSTFVITSKISRIVDERQYLSCMRLKEPASEQEKKTLTDEMTQYNKNIDELADILQSPIKVLPERLQTWNKKLEYLIKESPQIEDEIPPAPEKAPVPGKAPAPDMKGPAEKPEIGTNTEKGAPAADKTAAPDAAKGSGTETTTTPATPETAGTGAGGSNTPAPAGQVTP